MTGQRIGAFEILDKLGEGGMGEVWRARDTRLNRIVALKILPSNTTNDDTRRRLLQEARAASALNHPSIVTIHDIVIDDGRQAIAMEYVAGKTLDQLIPPNGMRLTDVLSYGIAIASGVGAAHQAGIVHRDLKPGNVMVTDSGTVKVLDFGLAKLSEPVSASENEATPTVAMTAEGTIVGTVCYMSPEQAEGRKIDARSDIFSFGALLYEMVTGRRAFQGTTKVSTITAILRDEPKPISSEHPNIPRDLEKIIARCLRKDRDRRYQTMIDVRLALEELKEESGSAQTTPLTISPPNRTWRISAVWLALPVVVGLAAGGLWFSRHPAASEAPLMVKPFTTYPGVQSNPAVSPDGKMVAFAWDGEKQDNIDVYVKFVSSTQSPKRLTSSVEREYSPVWSPDGQRIAYTFMEGDASPYVHEISVLGGSPRRICKGFVWDWSPDGNSLLVQRPAQHDGPAGMFLVSLASGETRRLITLTGSQAVLAPPFNSPARFLPDGRRILFTKGTENEPYVAEMDLNGREIRKVEAAGLRFAALQCLLPGGEEFVVNGRRETGGLTSLYRVPVSGGLARELPFGQGTVPRPVSAARTVQVLVFGEGAASGSIWRVAARPGGDRRPQRITSSQYSDGSPALSRDGTHLSFSSNRTGTSQIWISDPEGNNVTQLSNLVGGVTGTPAWSPDGSRIAFDSRVEGNPDIWVASASGGAPSRLTTHGAEDVVPAWSPDGRWIYFSSNRSGRLEIWRMPPAGGNEEQITRGGGFNGRFSVDGKFIYYLKTRTGGELWRVPAEGGKEEPVLPSQKTRNFDVRSDGVYTLDYLDSGDGPFQSRPGVARFYRFQTGKTEDLGFRTEKPVSWLGIALSPDGQWLYYSQFEDRRSNIMIVENFR